MRKISGLISSSKRSERREHLILIRLKFLIHGPKHHQYLFPIQDTRYECCWINPSLRTRSEGRGHIIRHLTSNFRCTHRKTLQYQFSTRDMNIWGQTFTLKAQRGNLTSDTCSTHRTTSLYRISMNLVQVFYFGQLDVLPIPAVSYTHLTLPTIYSV